MTIKGNYNKSMLCALSEARR